MEEKDYKEIINVKPEKIVTGFPFKDHFIILTETSAYAYGTKKALAKYKGKE